MRTIEELESENESLRALLKKTQRALTKGLEALTEQRQELLKIKDASGLGDLAKEIWKNTQPSKSRSRSSMVKLEKALKAVQKGKLPERAVILRGLDAWNRSEDWTKDGGQFALAIDRWVRERRWENLPRAAKAVATNHKIRTV